MYEADIVSYYYSLRFKEKAQESTFSQVMIASNDSLKKEEKILVSKLLRVF